MDSLFSDVMNDWSGTGRGCHVDFSVDEALALQIGDLLGHGADAIVHETTVQGLKVALKRSSRHKRAKESIRLEVEVLKKLSHRHLVRLIGSYTHKRSIGLLLYPVAVCDLGTFFEDAETYLQDDATDDQELRLRQLGYPSSKLYLKHKAWPIYSQIGCLISAVAYLHSQCIRHKDIKPSNILLSQGNLWLSDFGLARDFSNLVESGTDGGAGTARYKAPEVANLERSGRASDMFSLGCVLLEAMVFDQDGSLTRLRPESPTTRFVYHESLEKLNDWLPWPEDLDPVKHHLCLAIRGLLSIFPKQRPSADELVSQISLCDNMTEDTCDRIFSNCCRILYFNERHFESRIKALQVQILDLRQEKQIGQQTQKEHVIFTSSPTTKNTELPYVKYLKKLDDKPIPWFTLLFLAYSIGHLSSREQVLSVIVIVNLVQSYMALFVIEMLLQPNLKVRERPVEFATCFAMMLPLPILQNYIDAS